MRIALVWAGEAKLRDMTVRLDLYEAGFKALGHDAFIVCRSGAGEGFPCAVVSFATNAQLVDPEFWRSLQTDLVIMITWNKMVGYLEAARSAGTKVIAIADLDGQASMKLFPRAQFVWGWTEARSDLTGRMRLLWYYFKLYLYKWRQEDTTFIRSTELSERVVFAAEGARYNFGRCLALHGRSDLIQKLGVAPYPIDPVFSPSNPLSVRRRRAIAVARWDSPQKNAHLLVQAIMRYYQSGGDWEIVAVGGGGEEAFALPMKKHVRFHYAGKLPSPRVAELLASSRVLLCSSRWESGPIVAFEALAAGCTLVTTPLPTIRALIEDGESGTCSRSHRWPDFVKAMKAEFAEWDRGTRATDAFSKQWHERLQPRRVCEECLRGI